MICLLRLSWLLSLGISLFGILIIENLYIQSDHHSESFGFIWFILLIPFLLLSLFSTFRFFHVAARNAKDRLMKLFSFVGGFVLIGVLIYFAMNYKNEILIHIGSSTTDSDSSMPLLNQQTFSIYFNFYTFALVHSISGLIGGLVGLSKKETEVES